MAIRIVIADDHALVCDGLRLILEAQLDLLVVGAAGTGVEALQQTEALQPDVVLMDIAMPEMNGIEATHLISQRFPGIKVIILSMHHTKEHIYRAMHAGAQGYLLKEAAGSEVVSAIRMVMKGQHFFGRKVEAPHDFLNRQSSSLPKTPLESLSQREREVLQHVVEGKTSAEIAELLSLSPKSVETYRSRLMIKLGTSNIPSLVKFALHHGLTAC